MKSRQFFVSNSSSSSFICEICGRSEEGYDLCLSEAEMVECENGHVICNEEMINIDAENEPEDNDEVPQIHCPICNFIEPSYSDLHNYFLKTSNITNEEVFAIIKSINKRRRVLKDEEYVEHVLKAKELTMDVLLENLKKEFENDYKKFKKVCRGY